MKLKKKQCEKLGLKTDAIFAKGDEVELSQEQFDALMLDAERVHEAQAQEIAALKPKAELGEKFEQAQRDEAEKFYRLCNPEGADEEVIKTLQTAPIATVAALAKDYKSRAEKLHPGKDRQSSVSGDQQKNHNKHAEGVDDYKIN